MGKALSYCYKCSTLLREDDFGRGKAVYVGDHVACASCAPEAAPLQLPTTGSSSKQPPKPRHLPPPSPRQVEGPPKRRKILLVAGGIGGAVVVALLVVVAMGGKESPPPVLFPTEPSPNPSRPPTGAPPGPTVSVRAGTSPAAAREAIQAAKRFAREHPDDLPGQIREYTSVALQWDGSPESQEAMNEVERIKTAVTTRVDGALADLDRELKRPRDQRDFGAAREVFEKAKTRLLLPEWDLALKKRTREFREEMSKALDADPDLLAHWPFDEGTGTIARDSTGHGHDGHFLGGVTWAEGKMGLGLHFDGEGSAVEIPSDPAVDSVQKESYTLALWFKPEGQPHGTGDQNSAAYGLIEKQGWHTGLSYGAESIFFFHHWLTPTTEVGTSTQGDRFLPGTFYHVAGVSNRPKGTCEIYVDGVVRKSSSWAPNAATLEYTKNLWRIGMANPGAPTYAWPARGIIDDVRMYRRALRADEVRTLYQLGN
jgi:hypothetical protein